MIRLPPWVSRGFPVDTPPSTAALAQSRFEAIAAELCARLQREGVPTAPLASVHVCSHLKDLLEAVLDYQEYRFSRRRYADLFRAVRSHLEPHGVDFARRTFVDLGCGRENPGGLSFLLLLLGAARCYAFDGAPATNAARAAKGLADLAAQMLIDPAGIVGSYPIAAADVLANAAGFDLAKLSAGDPSGVDDERLVYRLVDGGSVPVADGEADVVLSTAVLEHVEDVGSFVRDAARMTKRGGIGIHAIDACDHRTYADPSAHPLDYLTLESDAELRQRTRKFLPFQNRLRPAQFQAHFERHGFAVLRYTEDKHVEVPDELRARFVEPYRSMPLEALRTLRCTYVVRKR